MVEDDLNPNSIPIHRSNSDESFRSNSLYSNIRIYTSFENDIRKKPSLESLEIDSKISKIVFCNVCSVDCAKVNFHEHQNGNKHKKNLLNEEMKNSSNLSTILIIKHHFLILNIIYVTRYARL